MAFAHLHTALLCWDLCPYQSATSSHCCPNLSIPDIIFLIKISSYRQCFVILNVMFFLSRIITYTVRKGFLFTLSLNHENLSTVCFPMMTKAAQYEKERVFCPLHWFFYCRLNMYVCYNSSWSNSSSLKRNKNIETIIKQNRKGFKRH